MRNVCHFHNPQASKKKEVPLQLRSSGQCAWRVPLLPPTASHRPAMVSRWLRLVKLWSPLRQLPHAGDNHQRVRHVSQVARDEPVLFLSAVRYFLIKIATNEMTACATNRRLWTDDTKSYFWVPRPYVQLVFETCHSVLTHTEFI